jgi:hypothetical protein
MTKWFYLNKQNEQIGPVDESKLQELYGEGVINDGTSVWRDGMDDWRSYREILSNLDAPQSPPERSVPTDSRTCPFCGKIIKAEARLCKHCKQPVPPLPGVPQVKGNSNRKRLNFKVPLAMYSVFVGLFIFSVPLSILGYISYDLDSIFLQFLLWGAAFVFSILTIVFITHFHFLCWKCVPSGVRPFSPERATGFIFIPFYNLYWVFESFPRLAKSLNEAMVDEEPRASVGLGITMAILFDVSFVFSGLVPTFSFLLLIAEFVIWILYYKSVLKVINRLQDRGIA